MEQSPKLRVVHVDDSKPTLKKTKEILETHAEIDYIAGFSAADEALAFLTKEQVDLLLLDIEMPGHDGLWLAEQLSKASMEIVFVTSFAGYATKAFEVCALDYLMKPMDDDKIHVLLERLKHKRSVPAQSMEEQIAAIHHYLDPQARPTRIFINSVGRIQVIKLADVTYLMADGAYTKVNTLDGKQQVSSRIIKVYEDALIKHPDFVRISRSVIVNKEYIREIERRDPSRNIIVILENGEVLTTAFKTKEQLMQRLALF